MSCSNVVILVKVILVIFISRTQSFAHYNIKYFTIIVPILTFSFFDFDHFDFDQNDQTRVNFSSTGFF